MMVGIVTYVGWLVYKTVERTKSPNTSVELSNVVYTYPDLWVCPYNQYGCDDITLELGCVESSWETEAGPPSAIFYNSEGTDQNTTDPLEIEATWVDTSAIEGIVKGRGLCVEFKTSDATAFVGQERDPDEYLDYILLDMYWYPSGNETTESTTCVEDGEEWEPHREWVYAFLTDPEDVTMVSTAVQLSYSCITSTSTSHVFNAVGIGLTNQIKYAGDSISSYKAVSINSGVYKDQADADITKPYARLSMELKQQFDSWEIITEADPFEFAEILGNIGGFWDLILILWPLFFVAASQPEPNLKPRNFAKSVTRTVERASGIPKTVANSGPMRRKESIEMRNGTSGASLEDGFQEEAAPWEYPPTLGVQRSLSRRVPNSFRVIQPDV
ncbi:unnamed protein product [Ectocarpus sp. 13 AM-2016]